MNNVASHILDQCLSIPLDDILAVRAARFQGVDTDEEAHRILEALLNGSRESEARLDQLVHWKDIRLVDEIPAGAWAYKFLTEQKEYTVILHPFTDYFTEASEQ